MATPHTPLRAPQSRRTVRLTEPTLHDPDSVYQLPHGADWFWLALFAGVALGSGAYVWAQTGLESEVGRAVFFASLLLSLLWAALIYTLKLSACVIVGPRGLALLRGPWRTELIWAEVARLAERGATTSGQHFRWLIAYAHDGRELRIRQDMVADYARLRLEVNERYKLWEEHGGAWSTTGGGPFAAAEEVTSLITWWLIAAGACLLPGLYFALLIPATFALGIALVALATVCALQALRISLGRQTYTVDRRVVVARRTIGARTLAWSEVTSVERVRSRVRLLANVSILVVRVALALAARADSRVESFTWSPRTPEYLSLRAVGGRRIRVRLHRLARPDELLAWVEFYDRVARQGSSQGSRQGSSRAQSASQPGAAAPVEPALPDLGGAFGPADPWAATRGGEPVLAPAASPSPTRSPSAPPDPNKAATLPTAPSGPRVTRPVLGGSGAEGIDPRILAVIQDVAAAERGRPTGAPAIARGDESDWLNETSAQPLFPPPPARTPNTHNTHNAKGAPDHEPR